MQPTIEILERIKLNSQSNKDEVFTRLFRYMLRPDIYYVAYQHLYANKGAATKGVNKDTADGFGEDKIAKIIKLLSTDQYVPSPVRRTYIQKKSSDKMRPLGIPTFTDKLVQEVLRMILEAVYEPIFYDCSHGFRLNRSCHTALKEIQHSFTGIRWFVEGDIKGCFDNIDHVTLTNCISAKIKDARLIKLIYRFLKAGYMENWNYHATYSGTPQGGIVSPLLANIYLHELDKFMCRLKKQFDKPSTEKRTPQYVAIHNKVHNVSRRIKNAKDEEKKAALLAEYRTLRKEMLTTPSKSQTDKKLVYVRYADDFLIGVNGSSEDCRAIKSQIAEFMTGELHMQLSDEKTLITHSSQKARFLGYDVRVRRDGTIKPGPYGFTTRTMNNKVELTVPLMDKIQKFLFQKKIVKQNEDGKLEPIHRKELLRTTELEIVSAYNAELRGICNYYQLASNFYSLNYFAYLMEYSCLKTLAAKHKCTTTKIRQMYKDGHGGWGVPYKTKKGVKRMYFAKYSDCRETAKCNDVIGNVASIHKNAVTSFEDRLKANICELCGTTSSKHYEIHHVNKLKNLKGKEAWEVVMLAKRRKTIVLCRACHKKIHQQGV